LKHEILKAILARCDSCEDSDGGECINDECLFFEEYRQLINHGSIEIQDDVYEFIQRGGYRGTW